MEWVPLDNPNMEFGDRISTITIKSVYIHTLVGGVRIVADAGFVP